MLLLVLALGSERIDSQGSTVTVQGQVQTSGDEPVGGVWVALIRRSGNDLVGPDMAASLGGNQVVRIQSGSDGRFSIDLPSGEYDVRASESGFLTFSSHSPVKVDSDTQPIIDVRLEPTASIAGSLEPTGRELDGATVVARPLSGGGPAGKAGRLDGNRFSIVGLEPGDYEVVIRVPGYLPRTVPRVSLEDGHHIDNIDVSLDPGLTARGRVNDSAGKAAHGVGVRVEKVGTPSLRQQSVTLENGFFEVSGLMPGEYVLMTSSRRHAPATMNLKIEDGDLYGLSIVLDPLGDISGELSEGAGRGGVIYAVPEDADLARIGPEWIPGRFIDVKSGSFRIEGVPQGAYYVAVVAPGYLKTFFPGTGTPSEATTITVLNGETTRTSAFALLNGSTLSGLMTDRETGGPVEGATVEVAALDRRETMTAVTDSGGRFSLPGVGKGRYLVKVRAEGFIAQFFPGVAQAEEATSLEVDGKKDEGNLSIVLPRRAPADFNEDGHVDVTDLDRFVDRVRAGGITTSRIFDTNRDGLVSLDDFTVVVDLVRARGGMIEPPTTMEWKSSDAEPGVIRASLRAEGLVPSVGFIAKVHYDTDVAEFLGEEAGESLYKDSQLRVEEIGPGILVLLGGTVDRDPRTGDGELISLLFRPKEGKRSVRLRTEAITTLLEDDKLSAPVVPDPITLSLPPETFYLMQNVPNPFNPETTIAYELPEAVQVQLAIYNLVGQRVRSLVDDFQTAGRYEVRWDARDDFGRDVSSGVYFYSLEAGSFSTTKRMLLIR